MTTIRVRRPGDLGPALREVRASESITQSALANLAGVGRQWLNAFEMGDKPAAPLDMIMRVASALGVTIHLDPSPVVDSGGPDLADDVVDLDALLDGLA